MTLPPPKVCERMRKLHALMGSASAKECQNAHAQLVKLLAKHAAILKVGIWANPILFFWFSEVRAGW
jgi:hypothetical protein